MNVFIWGTGYRAENIYFGLSRKARVIGFIDNDKEQLQRMIIEKNVFSPEVLYYREFDYIIISAYMRYKEISDQIEEMGINRDKIIQFYNYTRLFPRTFFYNDMVVKDPKYQLLFNNYVERRLI